MSLFDLIGVKPNDIAAVGQWLRNHYVENAEEKARMAHARELDEFHEGQGDDEMRAVVNRVYKDAKNRDRRNDFITAGLDKYDNIVARICSEKATVYSEPPRRSIAKDDERYQRLLDEVQIDDAMTELDRKLALHEDALIWYRVRMTPMGEREPVLDVISPAGFWAIAHPNDRTLLVGFIMNQKVPLAPESAPAYRVWTHDQTFQMNAKCEIFPNSIEAWPLGIMPGVLATTRKPSSKGCLLAAVPVVGPAVGAEGDPAPGDQPGQGVRQRPSARRTSAATRRRRRWARRPTPSPRCSWAKACRRRPSIAAWIRSSSATTAATSATPWQPTMAWPRPSCARRTPRVAPRWSSAASRFASSARSASRSCVALSASWPA
jgi:hypothetical protein